MSGGGVRGAREGARAGERRAGRAAAAMLSLGIELRALVALTSDHRKFSPRSEQAARERVYRARETRLGRDVAIKVLPEDLSSNPDLKDHFEREAREIEHYRIRTFAISTVSRSPAF
jgi:hypothetical protein